MEKQKNDQHVNCVYKLEFLFLKKKGTVQKLNKKKLEYTK